MNFTMSDELLLPLTQQHRQPRPRRRCDVHAAFLATFLLFLTAYVGAAVGVFDWLPFTGEAGYTNLPAGGQQIRTDQTVWNAPLKTYSMPTPTVAPYPYTTTLSKEQPTATTSRAKRDDGHGERIRKAAQAVFEHDLDLQPEHLNGFRAAGSLDDATLARLATHVREELRRRKRRSSINLAGVATNAGIAALQHVFNKFDLIPKAYKKKTRNPGYEVGVPAGHPRGLPYQNYRGAFSEWGATRVAAPPPRPYAFGELSGGFRSSNLPITSLF